MKKIILCDAVPFCFGPISKMISIAEKIDKSKYSLVLLASGTSLELGKKSNLFKIINCNTELNSDLIKNKKWFQKADVFVNVMNPKSVEYALSLNKKVVYIDSLFWMWDKVPDFADKVDAYFAQNFVGVKDRIISESREKINLVGPIIADNFKDVKKKNHIVVNFGGIESSMIKIGKNSNYPFVIGKLIEMVFRNSKETVYFCGNDKIVRKAIPKRKNFIIGNMEHGEFLKILSEAKLLITIPGLTTTFEAFNYRVPTIFLPPENYSQFLNLKSFEMYSVGKKIFNWSDIYKTKINLFEDEQKAVDKILFLIQKFEKDKVNKLNFRNKLIKILKNINSISIKNQDKFIKSLGDNSVLQIAEKICCSADLNFSQIHDVYSNYYKFPTSANNFFKQNRLFVGGTYSDVNYKNFIEYNNKLNKI